MSTLRIWAQKFDMRQGVLNDVLAIMKNKAEKMSEFERLTVIIFDELYISNQISINRKEEEVVGPHKTTQVMMARGLFSKWKQPVYYKFDTPVTKEVLNDVITKLFECGFTVVATTSDLGSSNQKLWKSLNIGTDEKQKCFFIHPSNDQYRIYVLADSPHMMKLARNHIIDHGFLYHGIHITTKCLQLLLQLTGDSDLRIAHKFSQHHLDVKGNGRQEVKLATQLFSNSNAKAIKSCGLKGFAGFEDWSSIVHVLELFNNWFDILNSRVMYGNHPGAHAFGVALEDQCKVLREMENFITEMKVPGHRVMLPFQKGISLNYHSLPGLYEYLNKIYSRDGGNSIKYILTYRLNQDVLENCFSYLRGMGGNNDHPNAMDIQSRLRWFVLGKYSTDLFSIRANTVPDSYDSTLINAQDIHSQEQESIEIDEHEDEILTTTCLSELPEDENIDPMESQDTELLSLSDNFRGPIEHDDNDEGTIDTSNK